MPAQAIESNERLEFLGDAALGLAVGSFLVEQYPDLPEGKLSRLRSTLISEKALAQCARRFSLGKFLRMSTSERQSGGADKDSILADAFEAIIGAIFLDAGFESACAFVRRAVAEPLIGQAGDTLDVDYKSTLQELVQQELRVTPQYQLVSASGPDHSKFFEVQVTVAGQPLGLGHGASKKMASQDAARRGISEWRKAHEV